MVDYCTTIEDREQRNSCARTIVKTMAQLFPLAKENGENPMIKFWDQLAIMSDFKLDIDWPEGVLNSEKFAAKPNPVPMTQGPMSFNIYGKNLQRMMEYAIDLPGGEEKDNLIMLLANQMKKQLASIAPETAEDRRVFKDIATMTGGAIRMSADIHRLHDYRVIQAQPKKKRKK